MHCPAAPHATPYCLDVKKLWRSLILGKATTTIFLFFIAVSIVIIVIMCSLKYYCSFVSPKSNCTDARAHFAAFCGASAQYTALTASCQFRNCSPKMPLFVFCFNGQRFSSLFVAGLWSCLVHFNRLAHMFGFDLRWLADTLLSIKKRISIVKMSYACRPFRIRLSYYFV